ncbi:MAG: hypothetical protein NXY57DRAFT_905642 [Lentinula lateritia]|uniref:Uncharacterized protein n=1 Tax=Lentinula lateritia TaxID=40482 RepID=A0ABQ8VES8_9AGAR|nr:MAG: hypothetical protein NXY57DRAFT_905642 [Lentinula lateritia]KAJ4484648.1 hypothetical protein C8R41DRAFT_769073 [Lentinula lateritia]
MKEIYNHYPDSYLDNFGWFLAFHYDVVILKSALHDNLQKAGVTITFFHLIFFLSCLIFYLPYLISCLILSYIVT